jgi:sugar phosphate isomerase/epimerase
VKRVQIGYTLWPANFDLVDPDPMLDEAEALGVDCVEVPLFAARLIADGAILEPTARLFEAALHGRALACTTHALLSINLMDSADRLAEHERVARACVELSARLGARRMVLHCGLSAERGDALEAAYARQREALARLGDVAAALGVVICLETIWNFDGRETALPSRLAEEVRTTRHAAVAATLDYAHAALQCSIKGADLMDEVRALAPLAPHLHLNDCFGTVRGAVVELAGEMLAYGSGDLHLPLGWGSLAWQRLLTEADYPDDIILNDELHPTYWRALADDVAEMRRLAGLMRRGNAP